jgi:hypothetical protein
MTGNQTGPDVRRDGSSRARVHRPGHAVLVVLAATMSLVAPGADPSRIGLGIAGAERLQVDGEGTLVVHTAAGDVRQPRPVASRQVGGGRRPPASCDGSYCPALR